MSLYEKLNELFEERVREGLVPHTVILGTAERKEFESDPVFSDGYRELCVLWSKRDSQISLYGSSLRKPKKEMSDNMAPVPQVPYRVSPDIHKRIYMEFVTLARLGLEPVHIFLGKAEINLLLNDHMIIRRPAKPGAEPMRYCGIPITETTDPRFLHVSGRPPQPKEKT